MVLFRDLIYFLLFPWIVLFLLIRQVIKGKNFTRGFSEKMGDVQRRQSDKPCVWFHGVSVGEVIAGQSLFEAIEKEHPDWDLMMSTTTQTGHEVACKKYGYKRVFFYPFDFSFVTRRVIKAIRPDIIVLIEFEVWPNFVEEAEKLGIPVVVVNGRMTEKAHRRTKKFLPLFGSALNKISRYCVQNEEYANRMKDLGIEENKIEISGSMKYDTVISAAEKIDEVQARKTFGLGQNDLVIIGGSTHDSEEEALIKSYTELKKDYDNLKLILAPRHPERLTKVAGLLDSYKLNWIRKTEIIGELGDTEAVLLDTMGELMIAFGASDGVFIGGSLIAHGGQNPLEAAALGRMPVFGPNMWNFTDIVRLLTENDACFQVEKPEELTASLKIILDNANDSEIKNKIKQAVKTGIGATEKNLKIINGLIDI